jgi:hypothetical protein
MVMDEYTPTINREDLAPGLVVYKDVIPGHYQLIPYIEQVVAADMAKWKSVTTETAQIDTMKFEYPSEFKDPNGVDVEFEERMSLVLAGFISVPEQDYVSTNDIPHKLHDMFRLMKYSQGTYFTLSDLQDTDSLIVMYFFNDDYTGGVINFENLGVVYEPRENDVLIFPMASGFEYSISEITEGTKYSAISYLRMD